jgi:hypothetical protein
MDHVDVVGIVLLRPKLICDPPAVRRPREVLGLGSEHAVLWSRDGRSIAYVRRQNFGTYRSGDLRVADLSGQVRTVVRAADAYGGSIAGIAWTRPPAGTRYRRARPRVLSTVRDDGLTAPWTITRLAPDGERVAYVSCGRVFVWTPSTRAVGQAEPVASLSRAAPCTATTTPFGSTRSR